MTPSTPAHCLNCETTDAETPLVQWQYQQQHFWVCPDCLPVMIHKRHQLTEKLAALTQAGAPPAKAA